MLSKLLAGAVAQKLGFAVSFLVLGAIALIAFLALFTFVPETLRKSHQAQPGYHSDSTRSLVGEA